MKKTILVFGLISGAISSLMMLATIPFMDRISYDRAEIVGYTTIVLSFLLVYFGIRSYRDNFNDGRITFGQAFAVGLAITLISCVCYVVTWEIMYFNFMPDFMDKYSAHAIQNLQTSGASPAAIQSGIQEIQKTQQLYQNPLFNILFTFIEPFPVGLAITFISALILKRKSPRPAAAPLSASN